MIKRILIFFTVILLASTSFAAAPDNFFATALTGGTTGCLDAVDVTNDGIDNADAAYVKTSAAVYLYNFNSTSGAAEDSPDVIAPDNDAGAAYSGDGRWILIGIYAATAQLATGVQIAEFSDDGTMSGNSDTAVPTEKAVRTYADNKLAPTSVPGSLVRTKVTWSDSDTITLTPAVYHHQGTSEQIVYWDSTLTYDFGSGGSNAASDDLGASEWHYVYLDDSAIVIAGTAVISASELLNDTTAPSWSNSKHGWYNGSDRCLFAVLTDGSSNILEFFHAENFVLFANAISSYSSDLDTSWTDVTLSAPGFARKAQATFIGAGAGAGDVLTSWRTNGQTASTGHYVCRVYTTNSYYDLNTTVIVTDSSQKIEVKNSISDATTLNVFTDGFYLPYGI